MKEIQELIELCGDAGKPLLALHTRLEPFMMKATAGSKNHGIVEGSYHSHIRGVMNIAYVMFGMFKGNLPFLWYDLALCTWAHDLDKLWEYTAETWTDNLSKGYQFTYRRNMLTKEPIAEICGFLEHNGIKLNDLHYHGLTMVHGGWSNVVKANVPFVKMHPIAVLTHVADLTAGFILDINEPREPYWWWFKKEFAYLITNPEIADKVSDKSCLNVTMGGSYNDKGLHKDASF